MLDRQEEEVVTLMMDRQEEEEMTISVSQWCVVCVPRYELAGPGEIVTEIAFVIVKH